MGTRIQFIDISGFDTSTRIEGPFTIRSTYHTVHTRAARGIEYKLGVRAKNWQNEGTVSIVSHQFWPELDEMVERLIYAGFQPSFARGIAEAAVKEIP